MRVKYKIEVYKDDRGEWRWRTKRNGMIVMDSGESYKRKSTMLKTLKHFIQAVQENSFMINENE